MAVKPVFRSEFEDVEAPCAFLTKPLPLDFPGRIPTAMIGKAGFLVHLMLGPASALLNALLPDRKLWSILRNKHDRFTDTDQAFPISTARKRASRPLSFGKVEVCEVDFRIRRGIDVCAQTF